MLELLGILICGALIIFLIGVALKITWFVATLLLFPLKLVIGIGAALLSGALLLFLLPFTILAILAVVGGIIFLSLGVLGAMF